MQYPDGGTTDPVYSLSPQSQSTHQRRFFPQRIALLTLPIHTLFAELQIKIPKYPRKNNAHFCKCQVSSNTVPRPCREWLQDITPIQEEGRIRITLGFWQPSLRDELLWSVEVDG